MNKLSLLILCIVLFQSCKIYDSKSSTKEAAILFAGKVKVKSVSNTSYKFDKIIVEEDKLFGIGKRLSAKSKLSYNNNIVNKNPTDKYVKILLTDNLVNEIHLFNKGKTNTLKTVGFGAVGLYALVLISVAGGALLLLLAL